MCKQTKVITFVWEKLLKFLFRKSGEAQEQKFGKVSKPGKFEKIRKLKFPHEFFLSQDSTSYENILNFLKINILMTHAVSR